MKFSALIISLMLIVAPVMGAAPLGVKGQGDTLKQYPPVISLPNHQATKITGGSLIETGNKNILINPSFEHSTVDTGWTNDGSEAGVAEASVIIDGAKSITFAPSSETINLVQSSSLYQAQLADGVQGLAMVRIKSDIALSVCSVQAGTVSTTNCVTTNASSKWGLYKIPFVLGGTSNGISIASSGSVTGTVYVDDAFVGAVDLKQDVDQSRIAGESYWEGTASATCTRTSATIGALACNAALPSPTIVTSSMGIWGTTDNDLLRQTITDLPAGRYKAKFQVPTISAVASNSAMAINDGTTTCEAVRANDGSAANLNQTVECTFTYTSSGTRTFELYVASASSTITVSNNSTTPRVSTKFILEYFGSGSTYSSTCGANCVDTFSAKISNTGVKSDENVSGWLSGNCVVSGTAIYTCPLLTNLVTQKMNCTASGTNSSDQIMTYRIASSSSSQIVFAAVNSASTLTADSFSISCQKQGADFTATRTIIGSFNEVITTPGVTKPASRKAIINCDASSSITSQFGTSWITSVGNITAGGDCTITLPSTSFSTLYGCSMTRYAPAGFSTGILVGGGVVSNTSILVDGEDDAGAAATTYDVYLDCDGIL